MFLKAPRHIYTERLDKFISGDFFADKNLYSQLFKAKTASSDHVSMQVYSVPDGKRIPFDEAAKGEYKPCKLGDSFGPSWSTHWFKITCTIPDEWRGEEVRFIWNAQAAEGLIYTQDGHTVHGLSGGGWNDNNRRTDYILTSSAKAGEKFCFYIELACNGLFGNGQAGMINGPSPNNRYAIVEAHLGAFNKDVYSLYIDYQIIMGMAKDLPDNSTRAAQALYCANEVVNTFRADHPETVKRCKELTAKFLKDKNGSSVHSLIAIGHCHIDTAWLWPFDETKRKVARSWSTQCYLMDRYPDFKFACSQGARAAVFVPASTYHRSTAQQYEWLLEYYPKTFEDVKAKVKKGQFIPIGGSWVEMDGNIPTGESFVRQFLYGQRFFEKHFGMRSEIFWLPDTFGYSAQLPQLAHGAGMKYFFTQKLSWNNFNKFPHTSFHWVGLDGTKVLTHFCPADTYCAQVNVNEVIYSTTNHKDRETTDTSLLLFGNGDGGGGPTENMVERLQRLRDLDGLAKCTPGDPLTVYQRLEKSSHKLSEWVGELYFELHRGTYTSQSNTKRNNRKLEVLLHNTELLASIAVLHGSSYPRSELDKIWKTLLLCQFHDVLPGSSIGMVYNDSDKLYHQAMSSCHELQAQAMQALTKTRAGDSGDTALVFNALSHARTDIIAMPIKNVTGTFAQSSANKEDALIIVENIGPLSFMAVPLENKLPHHRATATQGADSTFVLENDFIKATFSASARLVSLTDKGTGREVVPKGAEGNKFMFYEDIPLYWDAWDVEFYSLETGFEAGVGKVKISETGPLRAALYVEHPLTATSTLRQTISVNAISAKIEFNSKIDWNENRRFLKVEFPVDIHTDMATYDVQYGNVQRPTHYNTSWDLARFEVCGHRFMDMSEFGYGVALINDCKYGYAGYKNTMRLSLLRSPKAPDENCDIGSHEFRYALYPHSGSFRESDVVQVAAEFNNLLQQRIASKDKLDLKSINMSLFRVDEARNVAVDWVKHAEDSDNVVVRLCEFLGGRATFQLKSCLKIRKAWTCNLLEDKGDEVAVSSDGSALTLSIKPYQVLTVMLEAQQQ
ncbi:Glycoside hydrolase, 38 vacuolar alpha mannosidase [Sorochytrium milnesiophthora]